MKKKVFQKLTNWITGILLVFTVAFVGCEQHSPMEPHSGNETAVAESAPPFQPLSLRNKNMQLNRKKYVSKLVTVAEGGFLAVEHGNASGTAVNYMFTNSCLPPYEIFRTDPLDVGHTAVAGRLAFSSKSIDLHPLTGQVFYAAAYITDAGYPIGVWNPERNYNMVLPFPSPIRIDKLFFAGDGTLFGIHKGTPNQIYLIDTMTGALSYHSNFTADLAADFDMTISPDNVLFFLNNGIIYRLDSVTNAVIAVGGTGLSEITGIAFGRSGEFLAVQGNGRIFTINPQTGAATLKGFTGRTGLSDLTQVIAFGELSYARVSLQVQPGSVGEDIEISLEMETTELNGGVAVTFQPHGTEFSSPAILNIEAHGVDFTGVNPATVDIYYDNQETGVWEPMQKEDLIVLPELGIIKVVNAKLPHFSRYALGAE